MIGLDCDESSPRASTSSYRTLVESDAHSNGASSSTTTLVSSSSSASPSPRSVSMSLSHSAQSSTDSKASLTGFDPQSNYPTSTTNFRNAPTPDKPSIHPRQLPLDLRFRHTSATSRARKTHVLVLEVESDVSPGASNFGAGREGRRRTGSTSTGGGVVGQFFRALGRRANSTSGVTSTNLALQASGSASEDDAEEVAVGEGDEEAQATPYLVAAPGLGNDLGRVRREIDASQSLSGLIS